MFKLYITEWIGIGLIVIATIGAILHPTNINKLENCIYKEYKDCERTCFNYTECVCYEMIEVAKNLSGNIILYYELPSYNQAEKTYATSRDNRQLSGELSLKPSSDCGNFTYNGNTPIAPCGAIADSLFNDTFEMHNGTDNVQTVTTGLIDESIKAKYRNPEGDLKIVFKDFAKPIHWAKNVWDLDSDNNNGSDNNGFQNEAFIAWMETNMKRKPVWRVVTSDVHREGLVKGNYTVRIGYNYPRSLYDGERWIILCGDPSEDVNFKPFIVWLTLAVIGIIMATATRPVIGIIKNSKSDNL